MPEAIDSFRRKLKHAFAVDPVGPAQATEEERHLVDRICHEIVRRRLVTPALLFLEVSRPMNYLGAQAMHFFHPFVAALLPTGGYRIFAGFLEKRGSIDTLCRRLEELEGSEGSRHAAPGPTESAGGNGDV